MRRLLERVMGRPSGDGPEPAPTGPSMPRPTSESEAEDAPPAGGAEARDDVIQALRHHIAQGSAGRFHVTEILENEQLFDRGYLDSFSYVEFLAFIEETYSVRIDDSQLVGHLRTVAAMADHILRERMPRPQ